MSEAPSSILLDTHIWIWSAAGASRTISPSLRALIDKCLLTSSVRVSSISVWEIGNLVAKNRIAFDGGLREWVYRTLGTPGIVVEPVTTEIALESTLLPEQFHGDPADRILLATAKTCRATLITHDKEILSYSKKHGLPALSI